MPKKINSDIKIMKDDKFWNLMDEYDSWVEEDIKNNNFEWTLANTFLDELNETERKAFLKKYKEWFKKIRKLMFSDQTTDENGYSIFSIGGDDSHLDFVRYIIRKGKYYTELFLNDPQSKEIYQLSKKINSEGSAIDMVDE